MKKILGSAFIGIMIVLITVAGLTGCARSETAHSKAALTNNQAAKVIVSDLRQHGISINDITINDITLNGSDDLASVEFVLTLTDGRTLTEKVNLVNDNGQWSIEGHTH